MVVRKTRVSFPKGVRENAKKRGIGLVTISVRGASGEIMEEIQVEASPEVCHWTKWMARILTDPNVRQLPELKAAYEEAYESTES